MRVSLEVIHILLIVSQDISTLTSIRNNLAATYTHYSQGYSELFVDNDGANIVDFNADVLKRIAEITNDIIVDLKLLSQDLCVKNYDDSIDSKLNELAAHTLSLYYVDDGNPKGMSTVVTVHTGFQQIASLLKQLVPQLDELIKDLNDARDAIQAAKVHCAQK